MMLGDVIAIEAEPVVQLDELEAVLVEVAQRRAGSIEMVEYAKRQAHRIVPGLRLTLIAAREATWRTPRFCFPRSAEFIKRSAPWPRRCCE